MTLEYSDYNDLVDILEKSNADNTYEILMKKEEKVLDTVNNVVKYYNDNEIKQTQLINMPLSYIIQQFFNTWININKELYETKKFSLEIFTKEDRLFYIGITFIIISLLLFIAHNLG